MSDAREKAALALAGGEPERVRALFAGARLDDDHERAAWALLLAEAGEHDLARSLADGVHGESGRALQAALAPDAVAPRTEVDDEDEAQDALDLRRMPPPADGAAEVFLRWFAGRADLYSEQWHDARRRRGGYRPVREPFTASVARAHLSGRRTVGQYLLWPDGGVSFAVVDLDLSASAGAELEACHGPGSAMRHPALRAYVARLLESARRLGLRLFPEDSGNRGAHLWIFFEPRRTARAARALLARIVEAAGLPPPDVAVEIFPKQEKAGPRGLSSLVKLPLGIHRATLRPCPLLDDRLEPIEDARAALGRLEVSEASRIEAVLGRRLFAVPPAPLAVEQKAPPMASHGSARSLAVALRDVPEGRQAREAAERMIDRCAVLRALVDRAYAKTGLGPDEARALIYSVGLVGAAPELAIEVLAAAGAPMRELHRVRGGLPSPVGCRKLLALNVARCAACPAGAAAKPYATPALFAVGAVEPEPARHAPFAAWLEPADGLAPDVAERIVTELEAIGERLRRLEGGGGEEP